MITNSCKKIYSTFNLNYHTFIVWTMGDMANRAILIKITNNKSIPIFIERYNNLKEVLNYKNKNTKIKSLVDNKIESYSLYPQVQFHKLHGALLGERPHQGDHWDTEE